MQDELFDRLQQYVEEAENSRREAYEESIRRGKAEKIAIEARRMVKNLTPDYILSDIKTKYKGKNVLLDKQFLLLTINHEKIPSNEIIIYPCRHYKIYFLASNLFLQ